MGFRRTTTGIALVERRLAAFEASAANACAAADAVCAVLRRAEPADHAGGAPETAVVSGPFAAQAGAAVSAALSAQRQCALLLTALETEYEKGAARIEAAREALYPGRGRAKRRRKGQGRGNGYRAGRAAAQVAALLAALLRTAGAAEAGLDALDGRLAAVRRMAAAEAEPSSRALIRNGRLIAACRRSLAADEARLHAAGARFDAAMDGETARALAGERTAMRASIEAASVEMATLAGEAAQLHKVVDELRACHAAAGERCAALRDLRTRLLATAELAVLLLVALGGEGAAAVDPASAPVCALPGPASGAAPDDPDLLARLLALYRRGALSHSDARRRREATDAAFAPMLDEARASEAEDAWRPAGREGGSAARRAGFPTFPPWLARRRSADRDRDGGVS